MKTDLAKEAHSIFTIKSRRLRRWTTVVCKLVSKPSTTRLKMIMITLIANLIVPSRTYAILKTRGQTWTWLWWSSNTSAVHSRSSMQAQQYSQESWTRQRSTTQQSWSKVSKKDFLQLIPEVHRYWMRGELSITEQETYHKVVWDWTSALTWQARRNCSNKDLATQSWRNRESSTAHPKTTTNQRAAIWWHTPISM